MNDSSCSKFLSLPNDLIIEILARVASHSLTTILNVKETCKDLHVAAQNVYIYRNVSLDDVLDRYYYQRTKRKEVNSFFERCKQCGNNDLLFREGILEYFGCDSYPEVSVQKLKKIAEDDHAYSMYVYSIILLSSGEDHMEKEGIRFLYSLKRYHKEGFGYFRQKIGPVIKSVKWKKKYCNYNGLARRRKLCAHEMVYKYIDPWLGDEGKKVIKKCDYCEWSHERDMFIKLLTSV